VQSILSGYVPVLKIIMDGIAYLIYLVRKQMEAISSFVEKSIKLNFNF